MHATLPLIEITDFPPIRRKALEFLQANLGYKCNQSCVHCHVNAGPTRTEQEPPAVLAVALIAGSENAGCPVLSRTPIFHCINGQLAARRQYSMRIRVKKSLHFRGT